MGKTRETVLSVAGREVTITNPDKIFFPEAGHTKLDLVKYYAAVAEGALRGIAGRPIVLKRYVDGAQGEPFFQPHSTVAPSQYWWMNCGSVKASHSFSGVVRMKMT